MQHVYTKKGGKGILQIDIDSPFVCCNFGVTDTEFMQFRYDKLLNHWGEAGRHSPSTPYK